MVSIKSKLGKVTSSESQAPNISIDMHCSSTFFLISPIGLEEYCYKELKDWCSLLSIEFGDKSFLKEANLVKGGVEFKLNSENVGLILNHCLKLPSRLLQRIHRFETRSWNNLEKELKLIPWKKYFPNGISDWEIAASKSKINNEKHIAQFLKDHFEDRFYKIINSNATLNDSRTLNKDNAIKAYLRVHQNVFTLSRDISGEHLHFRGYRKEQGQAPLRENLAAFMWSFLSQSIPNSELEESYILDPYVGSGTLLFEAILWNEILNFRNYPSDQWISNDSLVQMDQIKCRLTNKNRTFLGVDLDQEVIEKAQSNLKRIVNSLTFIPQIKFIIANSMKEGEVEPILKSHVGEQPLLLISNPPYGGSGRLKTHKTWSQIWQTTLRCYNPKWALALGPERECHLGMELGLWQCTKTQRFLNGGIRVVASLWKRK